MVTEVVVEPVVLVVVLVPVTDASWPFTDVTARTRAVRL